MNKFFIMMTFIMLVAIASAQKGQKGEPGAPGASGIAGTPGSPGGTGPKGDVGPAGQAGASGNPGATGAQGAQGLKGDAGAPGSQGAAGINGTPGTPGTNGKDGAPGSQGAQGLKGDAGAPGSQGAQGLKGDAGAPGSQGAAGNDGAPGSQGPQGAPGSAADAASAVRDMIIRRSNTYYLVSYADKLSADGTTILADASAVVEDKSPLVFYLMDTTLTPPVSISSPKVRDFLSSDSFLFKDSCSFGQKLLSGNCGWDLLSVVSEPDVDCTLQSFVSLTQFGCTQNCISNFGFVSGEVTSYTVADSAGSSSVKNGPFMCKNYTLQALSDSDRASCGYFCFFHALDQIQVGDLTFTCRFVMPVWQKDVSVVSGKPSPFCLTPTCEAFSPSQYTDRAHRIKVETVCL